MTDTLQIQKSFFCRFCMFFTLTCMFKIIQTFRYKIIILGLQQVLINSSRLFSSYQRKVVVSSFLFLFCAVCCLTFWHQEGHWNQCRPINSFSRTVFPQIAVVGIGGEIDVIYETYSCLSQASNQSDRSSVHGTLGYVNVDLPNH